MVPRLTVRPHCPNRVLNTDLDEKGTHSAGRRCICVSACPLACGGRLADRSSASGQSRSLGAPRSRSNSRCVCAVQNSSMILVTLSPQFTCLFLSDPISCAASPNLLCPCWNFVLNQFRYVGPSAKNGSKHTPRLFTSSRMPILYCIVPLNSAANLLRLGKYRSLLCPSSMDRLRPRMKSGM
jgi:hypothetical protein